MLRKSSSPCNSSFSTSKNFLTKEICLPIDSSSASRLLLVKPPVLQTGHLARPLVPLLSIHSSMHFLQKLCWHLVEAEFILNSRQIGQEKDFFSCTCHLAASCITSPFSGSSSDILVLCKLFQMRHQLSQPQINGFRLSWKLAAVRSQRKCRAPATEAFVCKFYNVNVQLYSLQI